MGMYTYFEFIGELKKEFVNDVKELFVDTYDKEAWDEFAKRYKFAKEFAKLPSANFIPFGAVLSTCISSGNYRDFIGYTWCFNCELKNYDNEIDTFLQQIARKICTKFVAKIWYEEDDFPRIVIVDNSITLTLEDNYININ